MVSHILISGIKTLGLSEDIKKLETLINFIELIAKWNKTYNLTAIRDKNEMATRHILDSLAIHPHLHGQRLIDIGTGAGLPAIPLAVFNPEKQFVLIDSNAKKTRFVQQAILELNLANVEVYHTRVENFKPESGFDTVMCRAFASMTNIVKLTQHLFNKNGLLLAMKAKISQQELSNLSPNYQVITLHVPAIAESRCVVCFSRENQSQ